jgi:hypothetical protein
MFTAAFTAAKPWKQPVCSLKDDWVNRIWHTLTMEYYLVLKKEKIWMQDIVWTNLEDAMLSEVSQLQNGKYCMIPPI